MRCEEVTLRVEYFSLGELDSQERGMVLMARKAAETMSYSPYSGYCVGCAMKTNKAVVVQNANVENAAYGSAMCAERTCLYAANTMASGQHITMMAVTGRPAGAGTQYSGPAPVAPCGACRQVLFEAEQRSGRPIVILMDCFNDAEIARVVGVSSLLPLAFGPKDLGLTG